MPPQASRWFSEMSERSVRSLTHLEGFSWCPEDSKGLRRSLREALGFLAAPVNAVADVGMCVGEVRGLSARCWVWNVQVLGFEYPSVGFGASACRGSRV